MYFKEGASITTISRKISTPRSTIRRWICNFAEENAIDMPSKKYCKQSEEQDNNADVRCIAEGDEKALRAEIKRLEKELRREKLRADLNAEIINVAERKFNIQIREKAGAKR